jgi:two-component system phosphate regulon sensor histidine kinase PhoR
MIGGQELSTYRSRYPFWIHLIDQLVDVLDTHGVCAAVAKSLSDYVAATVIVSLKDPSLEHVDVWISNPAEDTFQTRWFQSNALLAFLREEGVPITLDNSDARTAHLESSEIWESASAKILAAPIPFPTKRDSRRAAGAIFILEPVEGTELELERLGFIASQVTVYLDRAWLRQKTDRQTVEFGLISDISNSITASLNQRDIAISVADAARRALGTERISIGLTDPAGERLVFIRSILDPRFKSLPEVSLQIGEGIAGWVAKYGEPAIVNDAYGDDRFYAKFDNLTGFETRSIMCVPLRIEDDVIGVLEAVNKYQGAFDNSDLRLLQAITGPLAIAIQNARLHDTAVTERRRVETIFASMSEGMLTVNRKGRITAANEALHTLLEYTDEELAGKELTEVIRTQQPGFVEFIELVTEDDNQFQQLICDIESLGGGFVPVIVSGASITHENGYVDKLVFVFSDLTHIREIERMRDDFFNNIVHELHTPLATILMYARLLRKGKAVGDKQKSNRFLEIIEQESNRLQIMVRQMLHLAKLQATELQTVEDSCHLNLVFDQLIPPLSERAAGKELLFEANIQIDLPLIQGDEETLYMIFKNLIENAIKFTPSGTVSVNASLEGQWVSVSISDEGIGIPPEGMPNLFSRFYRAQTAVEMGIAGTGLGLYMVKEGLDYCGGTIEVNSEIGIGTTFLVRVPLAQD